MKQPFRNNPQLIPRPGNVVECVQHDYSLSEIMRLIKMNSPYIVKDAVQGGDTMLDDCWRISLEGVDTSGYYITRFRADDFVLVTPTAHVESKAFNTDDAWDRSMKGM